jgi:hypothetical protein
MVESMKSIAAHIGAVCYADPFLPTTDDTAEESVLTRWIAPATGGNSRQAYRAAEG